MKIVHLSLFLARCVCHYRRRRCRRYVITGEYNLALRTASSVTCLQPYENGHSRNCSYQQWETEHFSLHDEPPLLPDSDSPIEVLILHFLCEVAWYLTWKFYSSRLGHYVSTRLYRAPDTSPKSRISLFAIRTMLISVCRGDGTST